MRIFAILTLLFGACLVGFAQEPEKKQQQPPIIIRIEPAEEPSPTLEDYDEYLNHYKELRKDFFKLEKWKDVQLRKKDDPKVVKKFSEFPEFEQHMFCISLAGRLSSEMVSLDEAWRGELKKFSDAKHKILPRKEIKNDKQKPALKPDVEKYLKELTELRKGFAVEFESYAEKTLKKYEKEVPEAERNKRLKDIRDFHDKHKLIERK